VFSISLMKTLIYWMYYLGAGRQTTLIRIGTLSAFQDTRKGRILDSLVSGGFPSSLGTKSPDPWRQVVNISEAKGIMTIFLEVSILFFLLYGSNRNGNIDGREGRHGAVS